MRADFAFLDHDGPIAFAHRGGSAEAPENTAAAFAHAISLGYRYLETDVHASSDGVAVALHDPDLERVADRPGLARELSWKELSQVRLADDQPILRLDELLERWPEARFNLDAKHATSVDPLCDVLRRCDAIDRVCVTSFSDRRLNAVRQQLGPKLCTALGPIQVAALRAASWLPRPSVLGSRWAGAGAAQVPLNDRFVPIVDRRFVNAAHSTGVAVHVWTIDDEPTMERLLDLGVDGIMTDRPTLLRSVLQRRGLWS